MRNYAVIGLGFGDEGKGHVVDYLCTRVSNPLVVRFSGGPQAAHQVILENGSSHVFSHFGSGTLRGAPTYWSKYCYTNPIALWNELDDLLDKGIKPTIYIDAKSPVITPYDVQATVDVPERQAHGTCAAGIYPAFVRENNLAFHLWFEDFYFLPQLRMKMACMEKLTKRDDVQLDDFYWAVKKIVNHPSVRLVDEMLRYFGGDSGHSAPYHKHSLIFEGSQGLLLDQRYGFFPHVTPTNTGMTNIVELLRGDDPFPRVCLVTRSYQTRHGNGPMSPIIEMNMRPNPVEKNHDGGPQGVFRKTLLDLGMLRYAIRKDEHIQSAIPYQSSLFLNHLDLVEGDYRTQYYGDIQHWDREENFVRAIQDTVGTDEVFCSYGPTAEQIKRFEK